MTDTISRQQLRWLARKDIKAYVKACPDVLDTPWAKQMKALRRYADIVQQHDILRAALVRKFGPDILDRKIGDICNVSTEDASEPVAVHEVTYTMRDLAEYRGAKS